MKFTLTIIVITFLSVNLFPDMTLWNKARKIAAENWRLVPGETHHIIKVINNRNEEMVFEVELFVAHRLDENGVIVNEKLEINIEGDIMDRAKGRVEEILKKDMTPKKEGMLLSTDPNNPQVNPLGKKREIDGKMCKGFEFSYKGADKMSFNGIMWIDIQTGAPVLSEFSTKDSPLFVGEINFCRTFQYDPETNTLIEQELSTSMDINYLLQNLNNKTIIRYYDYWEYED